MCTSTEAVVVIVLLFYVCLTKLLFSPFALNLFLDLHRRISFRRKVVFGLQIPLHYANDCYDSSMFLTLVLCYFCAALTLPFFFLKEFL